MIGGLADWFAVTAMFRHPLGIPIPHTAIIPSRKDQIGRSLGEFLQANFLSGPVVAERLPASRPGARLAEWLGPARAAPRPSPATPPTPSSPSPAPCDDDEIQTRDRGPRRQPRLRSAPVAPLAGRLLGAVTEGGRHHELLDEPAPRASTGTWSRSSEHAPRPVRPGVAVVGARADRRPHLREALRRAAGVPRRGRRRPAPRGPRARSTSGWPSSSSDSRTIPTLHRPRRGPQGGAAGPPRAAGVDRRRCGPTLKRTIAEQAADPASPLRQRLESAVTARWASAWPPTRPSRPGSTPAWPASPRYVLDEYARATSAEIIRQTVERWDAERRHRPARAAPRPRPAVHPHQRHGGRRPRRARPLRRQRGHRLGCRAASAASTL